MLSFSSDKYPEVNLLDHMVVQLLTFGGISILFFKVATSNTFYFDMISDIQKSDCKESQRLFTWLHQLLTFITIALSFLFSFSISLCVYVCIEHYYLHTKFFIWGHIAHHVGSQFPNQGSNPHPLQRKHGVFNHWTAKEVPKIFKFLNCALISYRHNSSSPLNSCVFISKKIKTFSYILQYSS